MIATEEQQTAIPPIVAVEPTASVPTAVAPAPAPAPSIPTAVAPAPAPAPTEDVVPLLEEPAPLIVLDSEIAGVEGSTIDQFIAASPTEQTAPIAGGILTDAAVVVFDVGIASRTICPKFPASATMQGMWADLELSMT